MLLSEETTADAPAALSLHTEQDGHAHTHTHEQHLVQDKEAAVGDTRKKGRGRKDAQRDLFFVRQKGNEVKYICVVLCFVVAKWCKFGFNQRLICKTAD